MGLSLGGVLGGIGGFFAGGPAGAAAGYNLGSSLGGSSGGSSGGGSNGAPWNAGFILPYYNAVSNNYKKYSPKYFRGNTVAGFNPWQKQGMQSLFNAGQRGFSFGQDSENLLNKTMLGGFLNSNPYLDSIYKNNLNDSMNDIQSKFAASGRSGSGYMGRAMGDAAARVTDQVYGDNYRQERGYQNDAMDLSTQRDLSNWANDMQGYQGMLQAGGMKQALAQAGIDAQKAKWDWNQNLPWLKLNQYGAGLGMMQAPGFQPTPGKTGLQKVGDALGLYNGLNQSGLFNAPASSSSGTWGGAMWNGIGSMFGGA